MLDEQAIRRVVTAGVKLAFEIRGWVLLMNRIANTLFDWGNIGTNGMSLFAGSEWTRVFTSFKLYLKKRSKAFVEEMDTASLELYPLLDLQIQSLMDDDDN